MQDIPDKKPPHTSPITFLLVPPPVLTECKQRQSTSGVERLLSQGGWYSSLQQVCCWRLSSDSTRNKCHQNIADVQVLMVALLKTN